MLAEKFGVMVSAVLMTMALLGISLASTMGRAAIPMVLRNFSGIRGRTVQTPATVGDKPYDQVGSY